MECTLYQSDFQIKQIKYVRKHKEEKLHRIMNLIKILYKMPSALDTKFRKLYTCMAINFHGIDILSTTMNVYCLKATNFGCELSKQKMKVGICTG